MVLIEIGLAALVGTVLLVAWWARIHHGQAALSRWTPGRLFFLGVILAAVALSSMILIFLFHLAPVDAVLLTALTMLVMVIGAGKFLIGEAKGR